MQGMYGIKKAKGKYIYFIDSDDFIKNTSIEVLYHLIKKNDADIAVGNYIKVEDSENIQEKDKIIQEKVYKGTEIIKNIYNKELRIQLTVSWNKLYNIKLFRDIQFPFGKIHEDEFTTYQLYYNSSKVVTTSQVLYYYRYVSTSIMNQTFSIKRLDRLEALKGRLEFFKEHNEKHLYNYTLIEYESELIYYYTNYKKYLKEFQKIYNELLENYQKNYNQVIQLSECNMKDKIKFTIARISPQLYYYITKIMRKVKNEKN